jgi:hypothetical protein
MKKILKIFILSFTVLISSTAYSADPRLKVVATMAGYGVVGGALLGTASLAFGANGRSIAKGASLGLYAGLLFGAYVVTSYELKKRGYGNDSREDYYPDSSSPYEGRGSSIELPKLNDYELVSYQRYDKPNKDMTFNFNLWNYQF